MTRYTLLPDVVGDLPNIQSFFAENDNPRVWQNYFKKDDADNITYDLRAILELIDKLAVKVATKTLWKIMFKDCGGKKIGDKTINPWSGSLQEYEFKDFGRFINLDIDGHTLKFHTIKPVTGRDPDTRSDYDLDYGNEIF